MGCAQSSDKNNSRDPPVKQPSRPTIKHELSKNTKLAQESSITLARALFEKTKGQRFHSNYVRPTLASYGASCKVLTCYSKKDGRKYAAKTIPKDPRNAEKQFLSVLKEVGIMKQVEDHPNAVKLSEVYNETNSYYLVMECCDGGELFEHITKSASGFTERQAAQILRSLMQFLAHMHGRGLAHMDIKPENVLFDAEGSAGILKVVDFGSSVHVAPDEAVHDAFGTVRYSSPEMANDIGIGQKTDVWSAGVVMYFMLSGHAPFLKGSDIDTLNLIKKCPRVKFGGSRWAAISAPAKDCIRAMLEPSTVMRPTAFQVLAMPWLRTAPAATPAGTDIAISADTMGNLKLFASQSRMRRLLLGLVAANLTGSEANRLLSQFYALDLDSSGAIDVQELVEAARKALPDVSEAEVARVFRALDVDGTGTVDVKEFFAGLLHTMDADIQSALVTKSFSALDTSHTGYITRDEFVRAMVKQARASGLCTSEDDELALQGDLEREFRTLDANGDGVLSLEEFQGVLGLSMAESGRPLSSTSHHPKRHVSGRPSPILHPHPLPNLSARPEQGRADSGRPAGEAAAAAGGEAPPKLSRPPSHRILGATNQDHQFSGDLHDTVLQSHQNLIRLALEVAERARSNRPTGNSRTTSASVHDAASKTAFSFASVGGVGAGVGGAGPHAHALLSPVCSTSLTTPALGTSLVHSTVTGHDPTSVPTQTEQRHNSGPPWDANVDDSHSNMPLTTVSAALPSAGNGEAVTQEDVRISMHRHQPTLRALQAVAQLLEKTRAKDVKVKGNAMLDGAEKPMPLPQPDAQDSPKASGWALLQHLAFRNTDGPSLAQMVGGSEGGCATGKVHEGPAAATVSEGVAHMEVTAVAVADAVEPECIASTEVLLAGAGSSALLSEPTLSAKDSVTLGTFEIADGSQALLKHAEGVDGNTLATSGPA